MDIHTWPTYLNVFVQTFLLEKGWLRNTLPTYDLDICPNFRSFFFISLLGKNIGITRDPIRYRINCLTLDRYQYWSNLYIYQPFISASVYILVFITDISLFSNIGKSRYIGLITDISVSVKPISPILVWVAWLVEILEGISVFCNRQDANIKYWLSEKLQFDIVATLI